MRTIYLDADYICHAENAVGRKAVETDALDNICSEALECYKFIPAHDNKADLIQCIDSKTAVAIQNAVDRTRAEADEQIETLLDTIEELIIGG